MIQNASKTERLVALSLTNTLICFLVYISQINLPIPLFIKFLFGIVCFTIIPGFFIFNLLTNKNGHDYSLSSVFLVSCSLSFSFNFMINLATFAFKLNLDHLMKLHFVLTAILGSIALYRLRRMSASFSDHFDFSKYTWLQVFLLLVICFIQFNGTPTSYFSEELIVLRKIFDLNQITMNTVGFMPNEPTTYMFIPFYILIAMIAKFLQVDVVTGINVLEGFTSALGTLTIMKVGEILTGRRIGILILAVALTFAIFYEAPRSDGGVIFMATADRYGFSIGVLFYLALFHFLIHMKDKNLNWAMFIGLIYLIIEMAFVHAREALFVLYAITIYTGLLLINFKENKSLIKKSTGLLLICGLTLVCYKFVNMAYAPELHLFISDMRKEMISSFQSGVASLGWFKTIFSNYNFPADSYVYNIEVLTIYPGVNFLPIAFLALPWVIFKKRTIGMYFIASIILLTLMVLMSDLIRYSFSYLIGTYHLYRAGSLIAIFGLYIACDLMTDILKKIEEKAFSKMELLAFSLSVLAIGFFYSNYAENMFTGKLKSLSSSKGLDKTIIFISVLLFILTVTNKARSIDLKLSDIKSIFSKSFAKLQLTQKILIATVCAVFLFRICFSAGDLYSRSLYTEVIKNPFAPSSIPKNSIASLKAYSLAGVINTSNTGEKRVGPIEFDEELYDFIENKLPNGKVWFSTSSAPILIATANYSPVWTYNSNMTGDFTKNVIFQSAFKSYFSQDPNAVYNDSNRAQMHRIYDTEGAVFLNKLEKYSKEMTMAHKRIRNILSEKPIPYKNYFELPKLIQSNEFIKNVNTWDLDYILVEKFNIAEIKKLETDPQFQQHYENIFENSNYIILKVKRDS